MRIGGTLYAYNSQHVEPKYSDPHNFYWLGAKINKIASFIHGCKYFMNFQIHPRPIKVSHVAKVWNYSHIERLKCVAVAKTAGSCYMSVQCGFQDSSNFGSLSCYKWSKHNPHCMGAHSLVSSGEHKTRTCTH